MPANNNKALALVTAKSATLHFSPAKPKLLIEKLEAIQRIEGQAVLFALQVGALLWQTKATLKHGEFKPWIAAHIKGRSYRSCAYYMKLTLAFAERARPSEKAFAALPALDPDAKSQGGAAKEALDAVKKFAGELTLTELLIKHGITGLGLKGELTGGDDNPPAELSAAEQAQMELQLVWSQTYEPAQALARLLAEKARVLTADQREALEAELKKALQALRSA